MATMDAGDDEAKLQRFLQWLQANGALTRGCTFRFCGPNKGFGVFSDPQNPSADGVVMAVPLDLAITPMRVLQDPFIGPRVRALFEEGDVDDRFLLMVFLMVERLRPDSLWKPYIDMLPSTFGSSIWFTDDDLAELKGTTLYRASVLQRKQLHTVYEEKVKNLVEELLHSNCESQSKTEVVFEDFLWANSIFWTRALNIPFPRSYVFPEFPEVQDNSILCHNTENISLDGDAVNTEVSNNKISNATNGDTVWVEGLVPGIDFCNHGIKSIATWEVDPTGDVTGLPASMYLMLADQQFAEVENEILISYGNKAFLQHRGHLFTCLIVFFLLEHKSGNWKELLYLYGFVINNNPDDFLMIHYPIESFQQDPLSVSKGRLLEMQKTELRCLLPRSLLSHGFFNEQKDGTEDKSICGPNSFSWSGQRKVPSYLSKLVFPQEFITALRTIAMKENEIDKVSSLLTELDGTEGEREPSDVEVQAAVWEVCGDYGALEMLIDLLKMKLMELEEGTGTEGNDAEIIENFHVKEVRDLKRSNTGTEQQSRSENYLSCVIYRRGQKELTRLFLREAEKGLEFCVRDQ